MKSFYQEWLRKNNLENLEAQNVLQIPQTQTPLTTANRGQSPIPSTSAQSLQTPPQVPASLSTRASPLPPIAATSSNGPKQSDIIFENNQFLLFLEKEAFLRQKRFNIQDHLFHIKIQIKNKNDIPFLKDILDFLEAGLLYVVENIKKFYKEEDANICFLTLFQEPMINALNSGGFNIQEPNGSRQMIERILTMLSQFLISNQSLQLNETFKVYLKVLSIEHMSLKAKQKQKTHKKRTKETYQANIKKKKFGSKENPDQKFKFFWAQNIPKTFYGEPQQNFFDNKCLLICTILGLLQNSSFESKKDRKFQFVQKSINSSNNKRQKEGGTILVNEFYKIIDRTNLPDNGPYELESTCRVLSTVLNCQFIIFNSVLNSNNLLFMCPDKYSDELMPIYMYQPNSAQNHLIYIKNVPSFFKNNFRVCLCCFKIFYARTSKIPLHLCPKRETCFACRRFFMTEKTYINKNLKFNFCDKLIANEIFFTCPICNVTIYSNHCYSKHKIFCGLTGKFGYKCLQCNKFTYRRGANKTEQLKFNHKCQNLKPCLVCFEPKEVNSSHLCKLKQEKCPKIWPRLGFISHIEMQVNEVCPILAYIYREENKRGNFTKYLFAEDFLQIDENKETNSFNFEYFLINEDFDITNPKLTDDFKINLEVLRTKQDSRSFIGRIINFVIDPEWFNTTYICQDVHSTFLTALLKGFLCNGICPKIVRKGSKILVLEIKPLKVRFITSNAYLIGTENELGKQFDINFDYYFFPIKFLSEIFFPHESKYKTNETTLCEDKSTPCELKINEDESTPCKTKINQKSTHKNIVLNENLPDDFYFFSNFDTDDMIKSKMEFLENFKKNNKKWCLEKELLIFADQKLNLLTLASLTFVKESLQFQSLITNSKLLSQSKLLHPFSFPLCSLAGFIFKLFKLYHLNNEDIYCIANEFKSNRKCSKVEFEWSCVMDYLHPERHFFSEFNNEAGQYYFLEAIPDLYSLETKTAYFLNECQIHGHLSPNCKFNKNATEQSRNPFGQTFKEVNDNFFLKMEKLILNNSEKIDEIVVEWECQYLIRRENPVIQSFLELQFKDEFQNHPKYRLQPRTAVRGAFFDIFALKWSKKANPAEKFIYVDCNALYSFVCNKFSFMTGKYQIIMGVELKKIEIRNNLFYFENKKIKGALLLTILPPKDLFLPFLLYRRNKDSKTFNTLCKLCCENERIKCTHSTFQRAITSTYMISEIEYALTLNYKIISIYEAHIYTDSPKFIFKDFIQKLNFFKTKNSHCFKNCKTLQEKQSYCDKLNKKMDLKKPFLLTPENVKFNPQKRNFYKLCNNALFGKFSERNDKNQTIFASNSKEIEEIFFSDRKIEDIYCINDKICEISVLPNLFKLHPNRKSNCFLGAEITALARQTIHEYAVKLYNLNYKLYQINCDSLLFSMPVNDVFPIEISDAMGDFKFEVTGEILSYYSLGTKSYCITFKERNGDIKSLSKICGISLQSKATKDLVDNNLFDFYLTQVLANKFEKISVIQERYQRDFKRFKVSSNFVNISFSNNLTTRRYVDLKEPNLKTFPYGYEIPEM